MKTFIITISLIAGLGFVACKKTRTCSCKTTANNTTVTTPRSAASPTTETYVVYGTQDATYNNIQKSEMTRFANCTNHSATSVNTNTRQISVPTVTSVGTYTYMTFTFITADEVSTDVTDYDCTIK